MTKKQKRIVMYLAAFLVALALVSICLVGNTFARFTSNSSGAASVNVAKWYVTGNDLSGSGAISFGNLSPNKDAYATGQNQTSYSASSSGYDSNSYRWKSSAAQTITITNDSTSGVSADVTVSLALDSSKPLTFSNAITNKYVENSGTIYYDTNANGSYDSGTDVSTGFSTSDITDLFSLQTTFTGYTSVSGNVYTLNPGATLTVSVYIIWTSDDENGETQADLLDTIVGEYVTNVNYAVSWTAVQSTEQPTVSP